MPANLMTEPLDLYSVTSLAQRLAQLEAQPSTIIDLFPRHKHLMIKRSQRCRRCEHNLSKPEYNPTSIKFKIQLAAYYHVPEIVIFRVGELTPGKVSQLVIKVTNPSNTGTVLEFLTLDKLEELKSIETEEEKAQLSPALREICLLLAGLPFALNSRAAVMDGVAAPNLRVHPHVMAATYKKGAEYHCHKDSYGGTDNHRIVSALLYLNHEWSPGDGGELRVFAHQEGTSGQSSKADEARYVDIAPLAGRLVIFRSREVWHAVREPRMQRWAPTLWVMAE